MGRGSKAKTPLANAGRTLEEPPTNESGEYEGRRPPNGCVEEPGDHEPVYRQPGGLSETRPATLAPISECRPNRCARKNPSTADRTDEDAVSDVARDDVSRKVNLLAKATANRKVATEEMSRDAWSYVLLETACPISGFCDTSRPLFAGFGQSQCSSVVEQRFRKPQVTGLSPAPGFI